MKWIVFGPVSHRIKRTNDKKSSLRKRMDKRTKERISGKSKSENINRA